MQHTASVMWLLLVLSLQPLPQVKSFGLPRSSNQRPFFSSFCSLSSKAQHKMFRTFTKLNNDNERGKTATITLLSDQRDINGDHSEDKNVRLETPAPDIVSLLNGNNKASSIDSFPITTTTTTSSTMVEPETKLTQTALLVASTVVLASLLYWSLSGSSDGEMLAKTEQDQSVMFQQLGVWLSTMWSDPQGSLQRLLEIVEEAGPKGPLYFGLAYFAAELLAVPALPLTLSAGFLFGTMQGVAVVLAAGTCAASVAFFVGKTVLRGFVEQVLRSNPRWAKLDRAVGEKGFSLLVLVRLTPIFPFSISNYIYGASSIKFADYFFGTLLGFVPGTVAYVYTGQIGQALTTGEGTQPWYVYAAGLVVLGGLLTMVTKVATGIVEDMEEDGDGKKA